MYHDMGKREIVGVPNRILWDTGTVLFKIKKTWTKGSPTHNRMWCQNQKDNTLVFDLLNILRRTEQEFLILC